MESRDLLSQLRELFNTAHINQEDCHELIHRASKEKGPIASAYFQAAKMVETKYFKNPFAILKQFNQAKKELEKLIKNNPTEIEIRYLRYTIQVNTPAFVGYNRSKNIDRALIHAFLISPDSDPALKEFILFYLTNTNDLKPGEFS